MSKNGFLVAALAACVSLTSCSNDDIVLASADEPVPVHLKAVGVHENSISRSGIRGTSFAGSEAIGLFLFKHGGSTWNEAYPMLNTVTGFSNLNVKYTATGGVNWTPQNGKHIMLSDVPGTVYAYYPHSGTSGEGDAAKVAVTLSATQETGICDGIKDSGTADILFGHSQESHLNNARPEVNLTMNHALAMLSFKFTNDKQLPYVGKGIVEKIEFMDATSGTLVQAGEGTMTLETGVITFTEKTAKIISCAPGVNLFAKTDAAQIPHMLVNPCTVKSGTLQFRFTIDGQRYILPIREVKDGFEKGKNYEYTVNMKGKALSLTVGIVPWTPIAIPNNSIDTPVK